MKSESAINKTVFRIPINFFLPVFERLVRSLSMGIPLFEIVNYIATIKPIVGMNEIQEKKRKKKTFTSSALQIFRQFYSSFLSSLYLHSCRENRISIFDEITFFNTETNISRRKIFSITCKNLSLLKFRHLLVRHDVRLERKLYLRSNFVWHFKNFVFLDIWRLMLSSFMGLLTYSIILHVDLFIYLLAY